MSFSFGNSDRMPAIGSGMNPSKGSSLQQAIDPSKNRGADMVLTPDNPAWQKTPSRSELHHGQRQEPSSQYTGGRANTQNTKPGSYLPPDAAPFGARFDPITPDSVRGETYSRTDQPGRKPQESGEPDFDEMLPPQ
ncbi:hypothetical protein B0O80DRAFT_463756 [Mortierella sp. GBAus27b]|nr:hypothetical protein B0O80DRAFT_463756 [Mortierella sp. GBAus27b]